MLPADYYVKQYAPASDLTNPIKIRLEESSADVTYTKYSASSQSNTNIQFNGINPPSADVIVDRKVMVTAAFRLTFTGTNVPAGQYLLSVDGLGGSAWTGGLAGGVDAPRAFPLTQIMSSIRVKINSSEFTQQINQYIEPLMRYSGYRDASELDYSFTPNMPDMYKQYSDFITYGSAKNSLGNYGENGYRTPRGGFAGINVVSQGVQGSPDGTASAGPASVMTAVVDMEVTEPIFLSPLAFGKASHTGFIGVSTMNLTLNIDSQYAAKIWSHDATSSGKTISSIVLDYAVTTPGYVSVPEIAFLYMTPKPGAPRPKMNLYEFYDTQDYVTDLQGAVQPGQVQQLTVNNIQLGSVPKRVFIFVKKLNADKTFNDTDTYARIRQMNIQFGNISGILNDANEQQLYKISVENGLQSSWSEWSKHVGSVMCIDFARNISLNDKNLVGQAGSYQFQSKLFFENISSVAQTYEVHTVVVNYGYLEVTGMSIVRNNDLGDISQMYKSPLVHVINWEEFDSFYGAGFASRLKDLSKKGLEKFKDLAHMGKDEVLKVVKKALPFLIKEYGPTIITTLLGFIPGIAPILPTLEKVITLALQKGLSEDQYFDLIKDDLERALDRLPSSCSAGKIATKKEMKSALKRY